jgi:hypothetical protein
MAENRVRCKSQTRIVGIRIALGQIDRFATPVEDRRSGSHSSRHSIVSIVINTNEDEESLKDI